MSQTFYRNLAQTTPYPFGIEVSHAKGSYIYDTNGKAYLDLISGIGVSALGHGNEKVKAAIKAQVDKHLHVMVYGEFEQEAQNELADELQKTLPNQLSSYYFLNSGTEANEAAMKLAKRSTGRNKFIAFKGAYHGNTQGSMSVSDNEWRKRAYRPLIPGTNFIRLNNSADLKNIDRQTAAVILETIQGDAGVQIPDPDFIKALRKRCDDTGTLLILDEVQCGMGRSGKMWAFEHFNIIPDILTTGKALGAGMPIGCVVATHDLMKKFSFNPSLGHITTFGGHPVVCAAAAAGLKQMREENIIATVEKKGAYIEKLLQKGNIKKIRRKGLMLAVELESEELVKKVVLEGLKKGVLLFWFLSTPKAFRLAPPLNISTTEIDEGINCILELLEDT